MSTITPTAVDAGSRPIPGVSDPPTAPVAATSSTGNPPPFVAPPDDDATSVPPVKPDEAVTVTPTTNDEDPDAAFNALMDKTYGTGGAPPPPATAATPTPPAQAQEAPKPGEAPTVPDPEKDLDPTEHETKSGTVPVKKLMASLRVRREAITAKAAAEKALQEERLAAQEQQNKEDIASRERIYGVGGLTGIPGATKGQQLGAGLLQGLGKK